MMHLITIFVGALYEEEPVIISHHRIEQLELAIRQGSSNVLSTRERSLPRHTISRVYAQPAQENRMRLSPQGQNTNASHAALTKANGRTRGPL